MTRNSEHPLDEIGEDIMFLSFGAIDGNLDDLHMKYLQAFYQEEFDQPGNPLESKQNRPMVSRKKIHAWLSRRNEVPIDPHSGSSILQTIHKTYSGYLHAASPHVMEMYDGSRFVTGSLAISRNASAHQNDLKTYVYRAVMYFGLAAKTFGDQKLVDQVYSVLEPLDDEMNYS